jgi:hypothetical protein
MSPESVMDLAKYVPRAFEVIDMMPSRTLFPPYKSLLTTRLVCNGWTGTDAQVGSWTHGARLRPISTMAPFPSLSFAPSDVRLEARLGS